MSRRAAAKRDADTGGADSNASGRANKEGSVTKTQLQFTDIDPAFQAAEKDDRDRIFLIGIGAEWLLPCNKTLESLQKYRADGVVTLIVDAESHSEFCEQNGIVVGSPACFVYYRGTRLSIKRGTEDLHPYISAQLTTDRINRLVAAVRQTRSEDAGGNSFVILDF